MKVYILNIAENVDNLISQSAFILQIEVLETLLHNFNKETNLHKDQIMLQLSYLCLDLLNNHIII
jgi:hypothetical protein